MSRRPVPGLLAGLVDTAHAAPACSPGPAPGRPVVAAAYSVLLIAIVFAAIAVLYAVVGRTLRPEERLEIALGAG